MVQNSLMAASKYFQFQAESSFIPLAIFSCTMKDFGNYNKVLKCCVALCRSHNWNSKKDTWGAINFRFGNL